MGEPLFDQHPLKSYLSDTLFNAFDVSMPGGLDQDPRTARAMDVIEHLEESQWRDTTWKKASRWSINALAFLISFLSSLYITPSLQKTSPKAKHMLLAKRFAERFKYVTISSSLFDTSLSPNTALPEISAFPSPTFPHHDMSSFAAFDHPDHQHFASDDRILDLSWDSNSDRPNPGQTTDASLLRQSLLVPEWLCQFLTQRNSAALALAFALYINGYTFLFVLCLLALRFRLPSLRSEEDGFAAEALANKQALERERLEIAKGSYMMTLEALDTLILAGNVWNSVVNEAVGILELEERRLFYGPSSGSSPASSTTSLRVALHSTLQTTQTQADNVRQLFAPLTSSVQLSRLSEMYAPPTHVKAMSLGAMQHQMHLQHTKSASSSFVDGYGRRGLGAGRPMSMSITPPNPKFHSSLLDRDANSSSMSKAEKRSTWSGALGTGKGKKVKPGLSPLARDEEMKPTVEEEEYLPLTEDVSEGANESGELPTDAILADMPPPINTAYAHSMSHAKSYTSFPPTRRQRQRDSLSHSRSFNSLLYQPGHISPCTSIGQGSSRRVSPTSPPSSTSTNNGSAWHQNKFTLLQTTRHPLSLSSLQHAIQGAIGSKRYAAAHLLALRFGDGEAEEEEEYYGYGYEEGEQPRSKRSSLSSGLPHSHARKRSGLSIVGHSRRHSRAGSAFDPLEGWEYLEASSADGGEWEWEVDTEYWEDVRSVTALLTTALEDAAARLVDAMEESDRERMRESLVSPMTPAMRVGGPSAGISPNPEAETVSYPSSSSALPPPIRTTFPARTAPSTSFAPMPSPLTKFATHIHAISTALDEAREQLSACFAHSGGELPSSSSASSSASSGSTASYSLALQSYERLRRELGIALRECERGRIPLMEVFQQHVGTDDGEEEDEDVPALAHDQSSNEDADDSADLLDHDADAMLLPVHRSLYLPSDQDADQQQEEDVTTQHLLMTSNPAHLPPANGLEQIFESVGADRGMTREKSKLTREERIALVKAKRASLGSSTLAPLLESVPSHELGSARSVSSPFPSSPAFVASPASFSRSRSCSESAWGPGGEVVQELKDVILRVGERRKRLAGEHAAAAVAAANVQPLPATGKGVEGSRPRSMDLSSLGMVKTTKSLSAPSTAGWAAGFGTPPVPAASKTTTPTIDDSRPMGTRT